MIGEAQNLDKEYENDLYVDLLHQIDPKTMKKTGTSILAIVCRCGSNRLLKAEKGIRCQSCAKLHSHDSYYRVKEELKQEAFKAKSTAGYEFEPRIMQVKEHKNYGAKLHDKLVKMGVIKKKIIV